MPRKNTQSTDYPQAVIRQIDLLAQNIVVARKRRKETQAQWAKRLGVSQPTMARIEKGDPSVAMASYVMCMWLIQPDCSLADLIAPQHDTIALEREIAKVQPRRAPVRSNSPQNLKVRPADKRRESANDISVVPKTVDPYSTAQIAKIPDHYSAANSLAAAAKNLGYSSAAGLAEGVGNASLAAQAAKIKDQFSAANSLADAAKNLGYSSAEELARGMNSHSTQTAVGLAALIAKAQGRSQ